VLWWPVGSIFNVNWDWSKMSEGEKITNVTWIGCFLPIIWDGAVASLQTWGSWEANNTVSLVGDTALGAVLVIAGVIGAVYQLNDDPPTATGSDVAEAVVGPLAWASQLPLLLPQSVEGTDGGTVVVQCIIDVLSDTDWED
jgi:hypothetical protein